MTDPHSGLADLIAVVRAEALALGRDDLAALLPAPPGARETLRRPRIVIAGGAGRGKSRLINSLLGRPGLSPVGDAPTTAGWIEFRYGPDDTATAMITDPADPGTPRRQPISLDDLGAYVSFEEVTDAVLGVEARVDAPILREAVLVDTPGVAGPQAALRHADALLFVGDATEPIPGSEMAFLARAAQRLETVVVAVNKSDQTGHEAVLAETRRRLAGHPDLARLPVLAISARLAEQAGRPGVTHTMAARLAELAGTRQLMDLLLYDATAAAHRLRATDHARLTAAVARELLADADRVTGPDDRIEADLATVASLLDCGGLVGARFEEARHAAAERFVARADVLGAAHRDHAEQGTEAELAALPPRLAVSLAGLGAAAFDETQAEILDVLRDCLRDDVLVPAGAELDLRLRADNAAARPRDVLHTLTSLLTGSALVLTVLTGSGVVGAGIALAACAGWWRLRAPGGDLRTCISTWTEAAVTEAKTALDEELRRRVHAARLYAADALPRLLEARRDRLTAMRADRSGAPRAEEARVTLARVLDDLSRRSAA
ncbi:dynamin family protein [Actinoplanes sp. CA-030573]|uniref:dynamin family protein n=1 Tax=Actinoplanes sp. CA-030573 TaxID=3239898 RepID=UPI003D940B41